VWDPGDYHIRCAILEKPKGSLIVVVDENGEELRGETITGNPVTGS
jgi:hypothetical protein